MANTTTLIGFPPGVKRPRRKATAPVKASSQAGLAAVTFRIGGPVNGR